MTITPLNQLERGVEVERCKEVVDDRQDCQTYGRAPHGPLTAGQGRTTDDDHGDRVEGVFADEVRLRGAELAGSEDPPVRPSTPTGGYSWGTTERRRPAQLGPVREVVSSSTMHLMGGSVWDVEDCGADASARGPSQGTMVNVPEHEIPDTRAEWCSLSSRERRHVIRALKRDEPLRDERLRHAASGWAAAVLARHAAAGRQRRKDYLETMFWVATDVIGGTTAIAASGGTYSGEPGYDFLPAVRRVAERVRQAACQPQDPA